MREDMIASGYGLGFGTALGELAGAGRYVGLFALAGSFAVLVWSRRKRR